MQPVEKLTDFLAAISKNRDHLRCPFCSARVYDVRSYAGGFNMNKTGWVELRCPENKEHTVIVEAIG